jgi:hypothetical protein
VIRKQETFQIGFGVLICSLLLLVLSGCQTKSEGAANSAESSTPVQQSRLGPETVEVDEEMLANIKIEQVREIALPRLLTATGKVQFNEDQTAHVLAPLPGQVLDLRARVGDRGTGARSARTSGRQGGERRGAVLH